jgi:glycosyltransferase involved in cell wall biosynthesis
VAYKRSIPLILTKHDIEADMISSHFSTKNFLKKFILRKIFESELTATHRVDFVVCPSFENAEKLIKYGVEKEKVAVIPHGCSRITEKGSEPITDIKPIAIFVGSVHPPNVRAAEIICEEIAPRVPEVDFVIIGTVRNSLNLFKNPKNVFFTGFVSDETLETYYNIAYLAILPVVGGSGMKVKTLEFLSAGIPLITTSVGAQGYLLRHLENAIIEDNISKFEMWIKRLLKDRILWRKLSINGKRIVDFSWDDVAEKYLEIYKKLITNF